MRWRLSAAVAAVVAALYARTVNAGLYLDDHHHVRPWTFTEVLGTFHGPFDPLGIEPVYFRPLVVVTFALDWAVWGWTPGGFHVTNIALHAIACVAVLFLLLRVCAPAWAAAAGALLFAAMPANVASAVYISERSDAMVAILTVLGLLALGRWSVERHTRWLVALNVCFVLAIGSKEVGIAMILTAALFWWYLQIPEPSAEDRGVADHWRNELRAIARPVVDRTRWTDWLRVIGPMAAIAVATIGYRALVLPTGALSKRYGGENPAKGLVSAIGHTFQMVPWELAATAAPILALIAMLAFVAAPTSRGWRLALFGVVWVVTTCIPLAWLGQVEPRLLYVAEIGVAVFFAGVLIAIGDAVRRAPASWRAVMIGAAAVLLVAFGALTVRGTVDAENQFAIGSPKMLGGDLKIWTSEDFDQWPDHWIPAIRQRLLDAGLIRSDGSVVEEPAGG